MNTLHPKRYGVHSRAQLRESEIGDADLIALLDHGELQRLRRGWYAATWANSRVATAVQAGGVLTGPDALALYGAWDLGTSTSPTHVRAHQLNRVKRHAGVVPHALFPSPRCAAGVDPFDTSLRVLLQDSPPADAVIVCDSLLQRRLITENDLSNIAHSVGPRGDAVLSKLDPKAESGSETRFRLWARRHNIKLQSQVPFRYNERLDFLIGSSLVVECDSVEHHTSLAAYEADRARDIALKALGYEVIRLTYRQVLELEQGLGPQILEMLRRGIHRKAVPSLVTPLYW